MLRALHQRVASGEGAIVTNVKQLQRLDALAMGRPRGQATLGRALIGSLLVASAWLLMAQPVLAASQIIRSSSFDYEPSSGLLIKEIVEPSTPDLCVVTSYTLDPYGRRQATTARNCNGSAGTYPGADPEAAAPSAAAAFVQRQTSVAFTADQRFVANTTVAVGQPEQQIESKTYDGRFGVVSTLTGPNQLTSKWYYDDFGRKVREMRADSNGMVWTYEYCSGAGGALSCPSIGGTLGAYAITATPVRFASEQSWSSSGPYTRVYYDAIGRPMRSETQGSDLTGVIRLIYQDTFYNSAGQVSQKSQPYFAGDSAQWAYFIYDTLGRVERVSTPNDAGTGQVTTTTAYNGLVTTVTDPLLHATVQERDIQGNVVRVTDANGAVLRKRYDALGNLVRTEDDKGNVISTTYDTRGRKTAVYDPDMGTWGYCYDALGQLKAQQSPNMRGSQTPSACPANTGTGLVAAELPNWTTMAYDRLGRLTQRKGPDATSTWSYDKYANGAACPKGAGKLCEAVGANGYVRRHVYDTLGRPVSTVSTINGTNYNASVSYDALGRVDVQTYPSGLAVRNTYTATLGFLRQVVDTRTNSAVWTANAANARGQLTQYTYGNGVVANNQFYPGTGRLNVTTAGSGNSVQNLMHTYDDAGRLSSRIDLLTNLTATYTHDELNRLTGETRSGGSLVGAQVSSWTFDSIGNLQTRTEAGVTSTYGYNSSGAGSSRPHAVANVGGFVNGFAVPFYSYDSNGNMTSGATRQVAWTSFNKVFSISRGDDWVDYLYDTEEQRVIENYFGYSSWRTVVYLNPAAGAGLFYEEEQGEFGVKKRHYISAGGATVAMIQCNADPCTSTTNTSTQYWHVDHLGSTSVITNAAGAVVERLAYEPFGKRRESNGLTDRNGQLAATSTDRGFTGHEHMKEVGLINMNGRVYDPALGRFLSADPMVQAPGNLQSFNRYSYAWNGPLNGTDPSGYCFMGCFWQPGGDFYKAPFSPKALFNTIRGMPGQRGIDNYVMTHHWAYVAGRTVVTVVVGYFTYFNPYAMGGAAATWDSYHAYLATGDGNEAAKAGGITFGTAVAFNQVGNTWASGTQASAYQSFMNTLGHAAVGCASAEAGGGSCRAGAASAALGAAFTNYVDTRSWGLGGNLAAQAVLGGTASKLAGGSFSNGAATAAFGYLLNAVTHDHGTKAGYGPGDREAEHFYMQWSKVGSLDQAPIETWRLEALGFSFPGLALEATLFNFGATSQTVYAGLPGQPDSYRIPAGQVFQSFELDRSVTNTTLINHSLCCGQVNRTVMAVGQSVYVLTIGTGVNFVPLTPLRSNLMSWVNSAVGPAAFRDVDSSFAAHMAAKYPGRP